jgi:hypothetical protein
MPFWSLSGATDLFRFRQAANKVMAATFGNIAMVKVLSAQVPLTAGNAGCSILLTPDVELAAMAVCLAYAWPTLHAHMAHAYGVYALHGS